MIKPNELRIGNLFYKIDRSNTVHLPITIPIKVLEINMFNVLACFADENPAMMKTIPAILMSDLSPIPITPEILEKCGFVSNPYQDRYEFGDIHVEYCGIRDICWINSHPHIEYLHQLQNLYFALTGEELTFKP